MIKVNQIEKNYGAIRAVQSISFGVNRGECFGLLGPNGAGKSTTISILVGLLTPDRGSVLVDGQPPSKESTRIRIGVAPQALSLYGELTAAENLKFFGQLYGLTGKLLKERVSWALRLAALEDRAHHRVNTFSGGMKRRLNIAVALVHRPQLLLLDEPTVGVDPQSRNHIFEWIEKLKSEGLTILYTTHYMEEAQRLCDRVAIIDQGQLLALDSVEQLLRQHGGQSVITGTVEHVPPNKSLPGVCEHEKWRMESNNPIQDLAKLASDGFKFHTVQITRPDLESVFLALTGKRLRD